MRRSGHQHLAGRLPAPAHRDQQRHRADHQLDDRLHVRRHRADHSEFVERTVSQTGTQVTAARASYDGSVAAGQSTTFGIVVNGSNSTLSALSCTATWGLGTQVPQVTPDSTRGARGC